MALRNLLITISILYSTNADTFTSQCFSSKPNYGVSNSYPIAELFRVSIEDCLNYCILNAAKIGDGCSSVVYHKDFSTCQLYGHDGNYDGALVVLARHHDFFQRISWIGACQDRVVPRRGYKQQPKQYAVKSPTRSAVEILVNNNFSKRIPTTKMTTITTEKPHTTTEFLAEEVAEEDYKNAKNTISFENPMHSSECGKDEKMSYFVLFGYRLASRQVGARINGIDQSSCIMYCSQNINAIGTSLPCYSANYEPNEEKCDLYGDQSRIDRNVVRLTEHKNYIFADKFCIQTKKDCSAESPYIVYLFKQMHKRIISSIPGMNSVVSCIATCIDTKTCKAVTYKTGLCILHAASPAEDASLIIDGNDKTMVIENGCQLTVSSVPALLSNSFGTGSANDVNKQAEWEEWSSCQFGAGGRRMRVRQRQCYKCEDLQIEHC